MNTITGTTTAQPSLHEDAITELKSSVSDVITALTGQPPKGPIEQAKVGEDVLFTAIVHQRLKKDHPALADDFLKNISAKYKKGVADKDRQPLFTSVDAVLDGMSKRGKLSAKTKDNIVRSSFGKAQLDSHSSTLRRSAPKDLVSKTESSNEPFLNAALERVVTQSRASKAALAKFESRIDENPKLTNSQAKRQADVLERIFAPQSSPVPSPPVQTPTTPTGGKEIDPLPSNPEIESDPHDFVYLPKSLEEGTALIRIPLLYTPSIVGVRVEDRSGNELLRFQNAGKSTDGRRVFKGSASGISLSVPVTVRFYTVEGKELTLEIPRGDTLYRAAYR